MDIESVHASHDITDLADRFEERLALDVADRSANLHDHNIGLGIFGEPENPVFYQVGYVGHGLDRPAQVLAGAFVGDHLRINLTRRHV